MTEGRHTGRFGRLLRGLSRTRRGMVARLRELAGSGDTADEATLEAIEETLLGADCGVPVTTAILDRLRRKGRRESGEPGGGLMSLLHAELLASFPAQEAPVRGCPHVVLLAGVNGSGKTTTAGKLAARARRAGEKVILAAADTYRPAAVRQLVLWGQRSGTEVVRQKEGADPAAVVVDALRAAVARRADLVLVDTAGRLHTRDPLMRELEKIGRVAGREVPGAPHEVLLVLDAGTGQTGLAQGRSFSAALPLTGLVITKLDGTARGGVAVAISRELELPIRYVAVGEGVEDLLDFSAQEFVDGLLALDGSAVVASADE
ncbi:MAG: signal recognition particle-docking protein FtsY [Acidobacteriota bacterium]